MLLSFIKELALALSEMAMSVTFSVQMVTVFPLAGKPLQSALASAVTCGRVVVAATVWVGAVGSISNWWDVVSCCISQVSPNLDSSLGSSAGLCPDIEECTQMSHPGGEQCSQSYQKMVAPGVCQWAWSYPIKTLFFPWQLDLSLSLLDQGKASNPRYMEFKLRR